MDRTQGDENTLLDMARDLPELAGRLASIKDEVLKELYSPEYDASGYAWRLPTRPLRRLRLRPGAGCGSVRSGPMSEGMWEPT